MEVNETPQAAGTENVDALLESVYQPEAPMPQSETPKPAAPAEAPRKFTLKRGNEQFEKTEDELVGLAQKGLDYDINNRLLRTERENLELKYKGFDGMDPERIKLWKQYDEFAASKPEFAEAVLKEYQRLKDGRPQGEENNPLWDRLNKIEAELNTYKSKEDTLKRQREDQELDQAIKDVKSKLPEIKWDATDEHGFTTEHKVLKHMTDHGFPNFRAAALDLFAEDIINKRAQKIEAETLEKIESRYKKGLVLNKKLSEPQFLKPNKSLRDTSYDDILSQSLNELGIGG